MPEVDRDLTDDINPMRERCRGTGSTRLWFAPFMFEAKNLLPCSSQTEALLIKRSNRY